MFRSFNITYNLAKLTVTERYLAVTDQDKSWAVGLLDGSRARAIVFRRQVFSF